MDQLVSLIMEKSGFSRVIATTMAVAIVRHIRTEYADCAPTQAQQIRTAMAWISGPGGRELLGQSPTLDVTGEKIADPQGYRYN